LSASSDCVSWSSSVGRSCKRTVRNHRSNFPFPLGGEGPGVNEGHAQFGADQREVAGAIRRAIVDVETLWDPAAENRAFEDGQEGRDRFAAREGGVRNNEC
jgi:hypothetical protein